ncbi:MAG: VWA domain-containing protein [Acidimicrobiales bacterium]
MTADRSGQVPSRSGHHEPDRFPFSAVVGQDDAKLALLLAAVDPRIGGVLLRGAKGSAKTTLARGLAGLLAPGAPFVDLPLGATEDRVVGSIDLAAALTGEGVRFRPGLLAAADGGVLYVDEVNLLADHLVDVLLDVATSGVNRVEREGIASSHSSRFVLVGSMNPEEGELRPQLLDRFGLSVDVAAEEDPGRRAEAVGRRLAFDADPAAFRARWDGAEGALRRQVGSVRPATLAPELVRTVAGLCAEVGAETLRADLATCRAAAALAGLEGRADAEVGDVRRVAHLALAHRRRRQPFEQPGLDPGTLERALDAAGPTAGEPPPGPPGDAGSDEARPPPAAVPPPPSPPAAGAPRAGAAGPERVAAPGPATAVVPLGGPRAQSGPAGRRSPGEVPRGRLVGDREPTPTMGSVALAATVRAAAVRRVAHPDGPAMAATDVRQAVREAKVANLVVLAVDASGSMGAARRMEAAKGAVVSLLLDAYQRRDRVALVTFGGRGAEVVLRPTASVEVARARLVDLPTGGRTPLAAGLATALDVAEGAAAQVDACRPLLVLVSDGRATDGPAGTDPLEAARLVAGAIRRRGVASVVVDAEEGPTRLGLAAELAAWMGARLVSLADLSAGGLSDAVRQTLA